MTLIHGQKIEDIFNRKGDDREELHQWLLMDTWEYQDAMLLIAGLIPLYKHDTGLFRVEGGVMDDEDGGEESKIRYKHLEDLKRLWLSNPQNPERAEPFVFFEWAKQKNIDIYWLEGAREAGFFRVPAINVEHEAPRYINSQKSTDNEIDPSDFPRELDCANQAFRAVSNGYGKKTATIKNRTIAYLKETFPSLTPTTVNRIAIVANPDKAPGRQKGNSE